ncbi:MAG: Rrf2 family transcriptional regulator [Capsulimonadales bacterium]|nr:Rrf2 family transcriptional regulator [Capsulimonadales bacterium]
MFTFTKKTDYALLALSYLATEGTGRVVGPKEIARRYEIPSELLAKVMQTLSRNQIVGSVPGPTGGYKLVRTASEISIGEIIEAVDGPLAIAQCWDESGTDGCQQAQHCHLRGPLARIQEDITRLLNAMTLADVCPTENELSGIPTRTFSPERVLQVVKGR